MLTQTIREKAYGKLNLSLDVLGKRDDGYHEMLMLMQSVSLCDEVIISVSEGDGKIGASTNKAYIPNTEKNLGFKAAKVFMTELNIKNRDVTISIKKRVPVCAGMGGGSSDAAAVIRGLNRVMKTGLSFEDMRTLAGKVGSYAVSASSSVFVFTADVEAGFVRADFTIPVTVSKTKKTLDIWTNLWFDKSNAHVDARNEGVGVATVKSYN